MKKILIAGGSGLVGRKLTVALQAKGYTVSWLSRREQLNGSIKQYRWDPSIEHIDSKALAEIDCIINLAGTGIAEKRWTVQRKKELIASRTKSIATLHQALATAPHQVTHFISASAIGFYGDGGNSWQQEEQGAGTDFLSTCCTLWEQEADNIRSLGIKTTKIRIGTVLAQEGGALKPLKLPVQYYAAAALGTGKQWISWIHIDDLCAAFIHLLEKEKEGTYNAVSPYPIQNKALTKAIAQQLHKPYFLPNIPQWILKLMLGEMSILVLNSNRCSDDKLQKTGFSFQFESIETALKDLL